MLFYVCLDTADVIFSNLNMMCSSGSAVILLVTVTCYASRQVVMEMLRAWVEDGRTLGRIAAASFPEGQQLPELCMGGDTGPSDCLTAASCVLR